MAKVSVSGGSGGSYCKSVMIDSKALASLRAAMGAYDTLSIEQAREHGYISVKDWAIDQNLSPKGANNSLNDGYEKGRLERVKVRGGGRWGYWYRAKSSAKAK